MKLDRLESNRGIFHEFLPPPSPPTHFLPEMTSGAAPAPPLLASTIYKSLLQDCAWAPAKREIRSIRSKPKSPPSLNDVTGFAEVDKNVLNGGFWGQGKGGIVGLAIEKDAVGDGGGVERVVSFVMSFGMRNNFKLHERTEDDYS